MASAQIDPNLPANNSPIVAAELRNRLNALQPILTLAAVALLGWMTYQTYEISTNVYEINVRLSNTMFIPKFEYRTAAPYDNEFVKEMDELGKDGWEIISLRRATPESNSSAKYEVILKRQKTNWR